MTHDIEQRLIQHVNHHQAAPAMLAALKVIALTTQISAWLEMHDPKALEQVDRAIIDAEPFDVPAQVSTRQHQRAARTAPRITTIKLGSEQEGVLRALVEHKLWYGAGFGCGWNWTSPGVTKRLLDRLCAKGLVTCGEEIGPDKRAYEVYRATPAAVVFIAARRAAQQ